MVNISSPIMNGGGRIEVITGCMFAGKTTELINRVNRAEVAGYDVEILTPEIDDRYGTETINSHDGNQKEARVVSTSPDKVEQLPTEIDGDVVAIDEANFFPPELASVCQRMANDGMRVIVSGIDTKFTGEPFEPLPTLMAIAELVDKHHAVCNSCMSEFATKTQRLVDGEPAHVDDPLIVVGGNESYEARCRDCHEVKG